MNGLECFFFLKKEIRSKSKLKKLKGLRQTKKSMLTKLFLVNLRLVMRFLLVLHFDPFFIEFVISLTNFKKFVINSDIEGCY